MSATRPAAVTVRRTRKKVDAAFYLMLLPALLLFTLLIVGPALAGMFFSVTNYVGYGEYSFIGVSNYLVLFTDPRILRSYGFTIGFSVVTVLLVNAIALFLAVLLNSRIKFKTALRGVFFIPMVVSGIVIAYVFNYVFSTTIPAVFGGSSILANADWAWVAVVVVTAWQAVPSALIIYLAGLLAIPEEVYEASSLDGASPWRQFTAITLPLMAGYVVINTVLGFKNFLNAYDIIVGLTDGGPGTSTSSVAMTIFTGFTSGDYAYQMANAVVFFVITVLISIAQLRIINRRGVSL
ncbi:carbohydrate ABC transporter membrane protein 1, CUT1 family [Quadrisphaera granulorum]|uniref:Carbohydrate ABC transporter membrane protein 1 (CUT1 family) n=1 Tax=Quadrisphaera granulorum TaxID=317664 RepID=A0A315ZW25_9ACTN|nr:sugar ABC transporter permease [Quadrisphaera granulorum]PWJ49068.1 carbohydrate ABC transporter membrane protein 1 (CUT1 family) [Quadrisphaera granulorum]SZE98278.1 carbohydrate ABC transporter membrane protein 1, CUT1 family [Quadrisphaera granulorum]